jgi:hypothetical protein
MFRRLFWFVSGAVAGIAGMSWLKRRAAEMREAITPASVLALLKDAVISAYRWSLVAARRIPFLAGDDPAETTSPASSPSNNTTPRRHIASRPHNSHR